MMKRICLFIIVFLCIYSLRAQTGYKRIVSLSPSLTENIYLLNAQNRLVGCTSYCSKAVKDNKQVVGSAVNVNVEKVFLLQPDLVLTMQLTSSSDIETMRKLGITVLIIKTPRSFVDICTQFLEMGEMVGSSEFAKKLVNEQELLITDLQKKYENRKTNKKVFFQIGANPVFAVLRNTFMDDYMNFTHVTNIVERENIGTFTREFVLLNNPDVIIIATMGGIGEEEKQNWLRLDQMKAAKNNQIFLIDSKYACTPTPVNFTKSLAQVFKFIYD